MTDGRNDGNHGVIDRTHDRLLIESPQIFRRSAASADDQKVDGVLLIEEADGGSDLSRRALALHERRIKNQANIRITPFGNTVNVAQHCARKGRHDTDHARKRRQRLLVFLIEKPLGGKTSLQLLEGDAQFSRPHGQKALDIELIGTVALVDGNLARGDDFHAVFRLETQQPRTALEHYALQRRRLILQREIAMSRSVHLVIGQLTLDGNIAQQSFRLEHALDVLRERRYAVNRQTASSFRSRHKERGCRAKGNSPRITLPVRPRSR